MIDNLPPELICLIIPSVIAGLALTLYIAMKNPVFGCGTFVAIIALLVLGLTTNGLVAIGGAIVIAIVWIFVKFGMGVTVNVEDIGDGATVNVTVNK